MPLVAEKSTANAVADPASVDRWLPGAAARETTTSAARPVASATVQEQINSTVRQIFHAAENVLFNLRGGPFGPFAAVWEGALLLVRKHLFN